MLSEPVGVAVPLKTANIAPQYGTIGPSGVHGTQVVFTAQGGIDGEFVVKFVETVEINIVNVDVFTIQVRVTKLSTVNICVGAAMVVDIWTVFESPVNMFEPSAAMSAWTDATHPNNIKTSKILSINLLVMPPPGQEARAVRHCSEENRVSLQEDPLAMAVVPAVAAQQARVA